MERPNHNLNGRKREEFEHRAHDVRFSFDSLSGDNGNQWRMGAVNVDIGAEFYFIIEGTFGGGYLGDMAIDDVLVMPNSQCSIPTTTTTRAPITTPGRYTPLSCTFENGTCSWTDDATVAGRWKRRQGQADGLLIGPTVGKLKSRASEATIHVLSLSPRKITHYKPKLAGSWIHRP